MVLGYYLLSMILYKVLPAEEAYGTKLVQNGRPLKYRFNGKPAPRIWRVDEAKLMFCRKLSRPPLSSSGSAPLALTCRGPISSSGPI